MGTTDHRHTKHPITINRITIFHLCCLTLASRRLSSASTRSKVKRHNWALVRMWEECIHIMGFKFQWSLILMVDIKRLYFDVRTKELERNCTTWANTTFHISFHWYILKKSTVSNHLWQCMWMETEEERLQRLIVSHLCVWSVYNWLWCSGLITRDNLGSRNFLQLVPVQAALQRCSAAVHWLPLFRS